MKTMPKNRGVTGDAGQRPKDKNQGVAELSFDHKRGGSTYTTSDIVGSGAAFYANPAIARPAPMYRIAEKIGYRRKWRVRGISL